MNLFKATPTILANYRATVQKVIACEMINGHVDEQKRLTVSIGLQFTPGDFSLTETVRSDAKHHHFIGPEYLELHESVRKLFNEAGYRVLAEKDEMIVRTAMPVSMVFNLAPESLLKGRHHVDTEDLAQELFTWVKDDFVPKVRKLLLPPSPHPERVG